MPKITLKDAWVLARENFGQDMVFYVPTLKGYKTTEYQNSSRPLFVPISVTGTQCELNCSHCRGTLLKDMYKVSSPDELYQLGVSLRKLGCQGILLSGGSTCNGEVPLIPFLSAARALKRDLEIKIAVHTGLVSKDLARALAEAEVDAAMIDIIGCDETIREVYHLRASVDDFERSLDYLYQCGVKTSPHIVIGLHFGKIRGEEKALEIISFYPVASLVLVILNPLSGTPMADVQPPHPLRLQSIFLKARMMFSRTPLVLGCARPGGKHKIITDFIALEAGFNGNAYPAEGIASYARKRGLEVEFQECCCSLVFETVGGGRPHRQNDHNVKVNP